VIIGSTFSGEDPIKVVEEYVDRHRFVHDDNNPFVSPGVVMSSAFPSHLVGETSMPYEYVKSFSNNLIELLADAVKKVEPAPVNKA
jgi:hypothetical protein